ncbi:SDR family NAD(P)-dependent oxidoreductase [Ruegeria arenilitoris]|uniref:SDR family NAD(P)-dependent oxidoreductase n=1 Tax=Ruegeria arenilitoris TaxID=1173585 RepID=UPI001C2BAE68|nr:SDR family NAD(P)-dependent oxidoreductase [Ruegeria arenilitoris]
MAKTPPLTTYFWGGGDLTGKTVLITGSSVGLGAETARALASKGASVTIVVRSA